MKILLLNPNTSAEMTDRMAAVARGVAARGTEIVPVTADRGFPYISSRSEAQVAGTTTLELIARHRADCNAVVIAAFGDPGLLAARELFDLPVTGLAEASLLTACMLGDRFAIVTFTARMVPWYALSVSAAGLEGRFAGFRTPSRPVDAVHQVQKDMRQDLVEMAREAAASGADTVILGGAPLAGLAPEIAGDVPAVLIDPVAAAVKQAETLALLSPRGAWAGSFARPPAKAATGLGGELGSAFAEGR